MAQRWRATMRNDAENCMEQRRDGTLSDRSIPDDTQQQWTTRHDFDEALLRGGLLAKKTRGVCHEGKQSVKGGHGLIGNGVEITDHSADKPALFKKFFKWLKPVGMVLISDYCKCTGPPSIKFAEYIKQRGYDLHDVEAYGQIKHLDQRRGINLTDSSEMPPTVNELYLHLHTVNHDGMTFIDTRSERFYLDFDSASLPEHAWRRRLNNHANLLREFGVTFREAMKMKAPIDPFTRESCKPSASQGVPLGGMGYAVVVSSAILGKPDDHGISSWGWNLSGRILHIMLYFQGHGLFMMMLKEAGFSDVVAEDRTDQQTSFIFNCFIEKEKDEFISDFSQEDYDDIVNGWKAKLARSSSGEQRWGLFIAKKN
ncbi:hypothetical protein Scep_022901 [Stephania cephalantha]|uniref:phosphoethanolamine N-methyltransferase n=1 Tax=Stephania cephalantha TaxID=152367 RepID=A0AAP0F8X6_9MAGN